MLTFRYRPSDIDLQMLAQILTLPDVNIQTLTLPSESQTPTLERKFLPPLLASHLIPQILPAANQCLDPFPTLRPPPNPHTMALEGFLDSVRERHTASNASSPWDMERWDRGVRARRGKRTSRGQLFSG